MSLKTIVLNTVKWIHAAGKISNYVSAIVLFLMMIFISIDVAARYLFNQAIAGSTDFIIVMMVIFVFLSFAFVTHQKGHVRTDVLYERFPKRIRGGLDSVSTVLSLGFILLITWRLGTRAIAIVERPPGPATSYFQWPHLPFIIIAAFGCGLMCFELLVWFFQSVKKALGK